jgi:hypothetical protein
MTYCKRLALALALLLAMSGVAWAQTKNDLQKSITLVNQEIELIKATIETNYTEIEKNEKEVKHLQARLEELQAQLKHLSMQLDKQGIEAQEAGRKVDEVRAEVDERLSRFTIGGSLRARGVYETNRTDLTSAADDKDFYVLQRLRLDLGFQATPHLSFFGQIQDARTWGGGYGQGGEVSEFGLHQAYVRVAGLVKGLTVDVGRLVLSYGAERLIGAGEWGNRGNSFDGVRASFSQGKLKIDGFASIVRERGSYLGSAAMAGTTYTGGSALSQLGALSAGAEDITFAGLYGTYAILPDLAVDVYALHLWDGADASYKNIVTLGARVAGVLFRHAYLDMEAALQLGRAAEPTTAFRNQQFATAGYLEAGFVQKEGRLPFKVGAFASGASGDAEPRDVPGNDQAVSFVPLFPGAHGTWGNMDLFALTNLTHFGLRGEATPLEGLTVSGAWHEFYVVDDRGPLVGLGKTTNPTLEAMGHHVAREFDLTAAWQVIERASLGAGYSMLVPLEGARNYRGLDKTDLVHWLYLQGTVTF